MKDLQRTRNSAQLRSTLMFSQEQTFLLHHIAPSISLHNR